MYNQIIIAFDGANIGGISKVALSLLSPPAVQSVYIGSLFSFFLSKGMAISFVAENGEVPVYEIWRAPPYGESTDMNAISY